MNNKELDKYFEYLMKAYEMIKWSFHGSVREILEDKIDEIINWSKYFKEREDKE